MPDSFQGSLREVPGPIAEEVEHQSAPCATCHLARAPLSVLACGSTTLGAGRPGEEGPMSNLVRFGVALAVGASVLAFLPPVGSLSPATTSSRPLNRRHIADRLNSALPKATG